MRSLLSFLIALILMAPSMKSQVPTVEPGFRFGIAAGTEATTFINNPFNSLISKITIPGFSFDLNARMRIGKHWSVQLTPGWTLRPYRSHREFLGDSLDSEGKPDPTFGKLVNRTVTANLHEFRGGFLFQYHLDNTTHGFHFGFGPEIQLIRMYNFEIDLKLDSVQVLHETSDKVKLPMLMGIQTTFGYSFEPAPGVLLYIDPYFKMSPIFAPDSKTLAWGTAGFRCGFWL
jgi:hypothetical protein